MSNTPKESLDEQINAMSDAAESSQTQPQLSAEETASMAGLAGLAAYTAADYDTFLIGHGREKMVTSAVAPLVAAARGYFAVDENNYRDVAKDIGLKLTTVQGKRYRDSAQEDDAMLMPWYRMDMLRAARDSGADPQPTTHQFRPAHPRELPGGKTAPKYEFLSKRGTPLDIHPAVPDSWWDADASCDVAVAEGLLKGDSLLTAVLLRSGYSIDDLKYDPATDDGRGAQERLAKLLDAIPEDKRLLPISVGGVGNWHNNSEWNSVILKGRTVYVAFDADADINPDVWTQANKMLSYLKNRKAEPYLLSPRVVSGDRGEVEKMGVDDYLYSRGDLDSLLDQFTSESLPDFPGSRSGELPGHWYVSKDGCSVYEYVQKTDPEGNLDTSRVTKIGLGGRLLAVESHRGPSDQEIFTGVFDDTASENAIERQARLEVKWQSSGREVAVEVTGPLEMIERPPAEWARFYKATIPTSLMRHPEWPPERDEGRKWISAVKSNAPEKTLDRTAWNVMGWVPVKNGVPGFVVGPHLVADEQAAEVAFSGVSEEQLTGATKYGVGFMDEPVNWEDPEFREELTDAIQRVMDTYAPADRSRSPWTKPGVEAVVIGAALRPCLPLPATTVLYLVGSKGSGKSWTAESIMSFWQAYPGSWAALPGSSQDTYAATELATSLVTIWVRDDMAPSSDINRSRTEQSEMERLIRGIFNRAGRRRATHDMKSRTTNVPRAVFVATAENPVTVTSVKERSTTIEFSRGSLHPDPSVTDEVVALGAEENLTSMVTGGLVHFIRHQAASHPRGWEGFYEEMKERKAGIEKRVQLHLGSQLGMSTNVTRSSRLAADLIVALVYLRDMCRDLEMDKELTHRLGFLDNDEQMGSKVVEIIAALHAEHATAAPGQALMNALRSLLSSGRAYVDSLENPGSPPSEDASVNSQLGWVSSGEGEQRPPASGVRIGSFVHGENPGEEGILFEAQNAFSAAQKAYPTLIPYGSQPATSWQSAWDDGLLGGGPALGENYYGSRPVRSGKKLNTVRLSMKLLRGEASASKTRLSGVPTHLTRFLNGYEDAPEQTPEDS